MINIKLISDNSQNNIIKVEKVDKIDSKIEKKVIVKTEAIAQLPIKKSEPSIYQKVEKEKYDKNVAIISNNNLFKIHSDQKCNLPLNNGTPINIKIPSPNTNLPQNTQVIKSPKIILNHNNQQPANPNQNLNIPQLPLKKEIAKGISKEENRSKSPYKSQPQAVIKEQKSNDIKIVRKDAPLAVQAGGKKLVKEMKFLEAPAKINRVNKESINFYIFIILLAYSFT